MLLNTTVTVQAAPTTANTTYDTERVPTIVWTASQTTERANQQPLSGEIAFKDYGISEAGITTLFFFKKTTAAAKNGRIVDADGVTYDIYAVEKFPNHYEVIARQVVG